MIWCLNDGTAGLLPARQGGGGKVVEFLTAPASIILSLSLFSSGRRTMATIGKHGPEIWRGNLRLSRSHGRGTIDYLNRPVRAGKAGRRGSKLVRGLWPRPQGLFRTASPAIPCFSNGP